MLIIHIHTKKNCRYCDTHCGVPESYSATYYHVSERTRFGIIYQSEVELEFDGDVKVDPIGLDVSTNTKIPLAQFVRLSG